MTVTLIVWTSVLAISLQLTCQTRSSCGQILGWEPHADTQDAGHRCSTKCPKSENSMPGCGYQSRNSALRSEMAGPREFLRDSIELSCVPPGRSARQIGTRILRT